MNAFSPRQNGSPPWQNDAHLAPLGTTELRVRIDAALENFLSKRRSQLAAVSDELEPITTYLSDFVLTAGKRLRPTFAYCGWRGAGRADDPRMITAAAALEWIQACALIHDDVMDGSETRRGKPATHRAFAARHRSAEWRGDSDSYGTSMAILLGDFSLIWADEMARSAGFSPEVWEAAWPAYDEMRTEVMAGQYLDIASQVSGEHSAQRAMKVVRYKSAKYTIERPLHIGAALAGAPASLVRTYTEYGLPLGEAFQLRDDVLGVFGDPQQTGKPAGDDLREGKRTVLVARAVANSGNAAAATMETYLGRQEMNDTELELLRDIIVESGALAEVEQLIGELAEQASAALDTPELEPGTASVLANLVSAATNRRS